MSRALYAGCLVGWVVLAAAGCRMCAHPYDYCGPIVGDPLGCCPTARAGSILTAGSPGTLEGTVTPTESATSAQPTKAPQRTRALAPPKPVPNSVPSPRRAPTPAPAPAPAKTAPADQSAAHFFPGIPRENILSITDRRLDEVQAETVQPSETAAATPPEPTPAETKTPVVRTASAPHVAAKPVSPVKQTGWTAVRNSPAENP